MSDEVEDLKKATLLALTLAFEALNHKVSLYGLQIGEWTEEVEFLKGDPVVGKTMEKALAHLQLHFSLFCKKYEELKSNSHLLMGDEPFNEVEPIIKSRLDELEYHIEQIVQASGDLKNPVRDSRKPNRIFAN